MSTHRKTLIPDLKTEVPAFLKRNGLTFRSGSAAIGVAVQTLVDAASHGLASPATLLKLKTAGMKFTPQRSNRARTSSAVAVET